MIRKIVLVSEAPESHDQLVRSLAAVGVHVVPQATLRAAVALLRDAENAASVFVVDAPSFSPNDADVLAGLSVQYPQLRMMVFVSRGSPKRPSIDWRALARSASIAHRSEIERRPA